MSKPRDFSVHPVHVLGEPSHRYAKVRADEGVIAPGRRVSVQWTGETTWRSARVVAPPADATGGGGIVWIEIVGNAPVNGTSSSPSGENW